eukprot:jgi/Ulvmu1/9052/UM005_0145.1
MVDANDNFDHIFKILLVGDTGVGKSALLLRFTQDRFDDLSPTIGVDFRMKFMDINSQRVKLTIWDTAGQERFRTLTSSYYRGAHAIIFAYDVTRRDTFEAIQETWLQEVAEHSNVKAAIKMVVANKVDRDSEREVARQEGSAFAKTNGCLFVETSAKANTAVNQAFDELVRKILETPELSQVGKAPGMNMNGQRASSQAGACSC